MNVNICQSALKYICSLQINDWRYKKSDRITTTLYAVNVPNDIPYSAGDDLKYAKFEKLDAKFIGNADKCHQPMLLILQQFLENKTTF